MFKTKQIFLLMALVAILVSAIEAQQQCGQNEEFTSCGTACPDKCGDTDELRPCTLQCVVGCQCKQGYVLNAKGQCVTKAEC